ncbi:hypothetical protein C0995_010609 [Termitomyces sp. Mi166|nr:hypothetical protein C0995_010609 [Termitomyces sp. Mi166\
MPSILNLKFKGNKSFVAFSNLGDAESLTKTWKVCTKVASYLEQGSRLENLSWRLWHLQSLMVDSDNAKSKREFRKLSKSMGDKLDKEKGRSIEELEAPDYKASSSADILRQRAEEKERNRAMPGTIKRMQFTFNLDNPSPAINEPVTKPNLKPSAEFNSRAWSAAARPGDETMDVVSAEANDKDPPRRISALRFPPLFSSDFGPSALLDATPTVTNSMNYGEGLNPTASHDSFSISRPTIELPLDELLLESTTDRDTFDSWALAYPESTATTATQTDQQDVVMQPVPAPTPVYAATPTRITTRKASPVAQESEDESSPESDDEDSEFDVTARVTRPPAKSTKATRKRSHLKESLPQTVAPSKVNQLYDTRASTPTGRPALTVRTSAVSRSSGPSATSSVLRGSLANSGPGGQKAECSNCGATHTPLWRRGLNDELNCNACGLYCKLHKRPRPKSMRNTHGERAQAPPRQETVDVMGSSSPVPKVPPRSSSPVHRIAQCYNCHTTATPLWRKDDEGKTVCNACGLYYKLHGSARPISMKSDVIRKRSRHDARRGGPSVSETPSASPGVSCRASPARDTSPTLAPDSTTQMSYDYSEDLDYRSSTTHSELLGALGQDTQNQIFQYSMYPGPYHPDYLSQAYVTPTPNDPLPFAPSDTASDHDAAHSANPNPNDDPAMSPRTSKRRRMSTDSASEPPSSASYSSYNDGYTTSSSATSLSTHSMEFPFSSSSSSASAHLAGSSSSYFPSANGGSTPGGAAGASASASASSTSGGPALRGSGNTFWHPPMMPQGDGLSSPHIIHPPMLPPSEESPMDYLHQPMGMGMSVQQEREQEEELFSTFIHPPMAIPDEFAQALSTVHPPMLMDWHHDVYDSMRVY